MDNYQGNTFTEAVVAMLLKSDAVNFGDVKNAHDVMLRMRIEWQELESCLRNRKLDGFDRVIEAMQNISSMALRGAIFLEETRREARINRERDVTADPPKKKKKVLV